MGLSGISIWQLLIVLAIVVMLFGTKRLGNLGSDLGKMIKGFKSSINDDEKDEKKDESAKSVEAKPGEESAGHSDKTESKH